MKVVLLLFKVASILFLFPSQPTQNSQWKWEWNKSLWLH